MQKYHSRKDTAKTCNTQTYTHTKIDTLKFQICNSYLTLGASKAHFNSIKKFMQHSIKYAGKQ